MEWVPARGFQLAIKFTLAFIAIIALGSATWVLSFGFEAWASSPAVWAAIAFPVVFIAAIWAKFPYRIGLSPLGVTYKAFGQNIFVPWSGVREFRDPAMWGIIGIDSTPDQRQSVSAFFLTVDQARAILDYPDRPQWTLSKEVLRSLGVAETSQP